MIAVDTQILIDSMREDSPHHLAAKRCVLQLAEGGTAWAIPWPNIHEFLAIVTHPKIHKPPTPMRDALAQVGYWMESPGLRVLGEPPQYLDYLAQRIELSGVQGLLVHHARIAALCLAHSVRMLYTAHRDFWRFPEVVCMNPLGK